MVGILDKFLTESLSAHETQPLQIETKQTKKQRAKEVPRDYVIGTENQRRKLTKISSQEQLNHGVDVPYYGSYSIYRMGKEHCSVV